MTKLNLAAVLAAVMALATEANASTNFTGFHAGVKVGANAPKVTNTSLNQSATISGGVITNPQFISSSSRNAGDRSFSGQIDLGYSMTMGGMYNLGLEIFGGYDNAKFYSSNVYYVSGLSTQTQFRRKGFYGATLNIGMHVNPTTLAYIGLGGQSARWTQNIMGVTALGNPATSAAAVQTASTNKFSFAPSVGLKVAMGQRASLVMEYTYVAPKALKVLAFSPVTGSNNSNGSVYNYGLSSSKASSQSVKLGVQFKIGGMGFMGM
jgi:hypothetical protein